MLLLLSTTFGQSVSLEQCSPCIVIRPTCHERVHNQISHCDRREEKAQETDATPDQTNRATGNVAIMTDQNVTAEAEDERENKVPFEIRKRQNRKVKLNATFWK